MALRMLEAWPAATEDLGGMLGIFSFTPEKYINRITLFYKKIAHILQ